MYSISIICLKVIIIFTKYVNLQCIMYYIDIMYLWLIIMYIKYVNLQCLLDHEDEWINTLIRDIYYIMSSHPYNNYYFITWFSVMLHKYSYVNNSICITQLLY